MQLYGTVMKYQWAGVHTHSGLRSAVRAVAIVYLYHLNKAKLRAIYDSAFGACCLLRWAILGEDQFGDGDTRKKLTIVLRTHKV